MKAIRVLLAVLVVSLGGRIACGGVYAYFGVQEKAGASGVQEKSGTSEAAIVEDCALAHTGQMLPLDKEGNFIGQTLKGEGVPSAQLPQVLANLETALAAAGTDLQHIVKLNVYVDSPRTADEIRGLFRSRFHGPAHPAVSYVCTPLAHPKAQVAIDAVAAVPGEGPAAVTRLRCPSILGDARQSDVAVLPKGDVVYVSGIAEKGDLATAVAADLKGLLDIIKQMGLDRSQVVQVKAFIKSIKEADVVKQQLAAAFGGGHLPPLVLVEWISDLPAEIEMIVAAPSKSPEPQRLTFYNPPEVTPSPVFTRAVRVPKAKQIYISGIYAKTPGDAEAQVRSIFTALQQIAKEAGTDMRHLVKGTYYITNDDEADAITRQRQEVYNPKQPPAASKAMVKDVGMTGRSVTLDMIAVPGS